MATQRNFVLIALVAIAALCLGAADASAQCATCGTPTVAYQPVAQPGYVAYSGWYPGYWADRFRLRSWGWPGRTVSAYAPAYSVGYAPATYASYGYAPAAGCSTCSSCSSCYAPSSCSTCYAPSACSTCNTCNSCATPVTTLRQVVLRPVCGTSCAPACSSCATYSPCSTCGTCSTGCSSCSSGCDTCSSGCASCSSGVQPATYSAPASCPTCQQQATMQPPQSSSPPSTYTPQLSPSDNPPPQRTYRPGPADENYDDAEQSDSSTKFQAPQLFSPSDRTAKYSRVPVTPAVYNHPADRASYDQAQIDAVGWTSLAD